MIFWCQQLLGEPPLIEHIPSGAVWAVVSFSVIGMIFSIVFLVLIVVFIRESAIKGNATVHFYWIPLKTIKIHLRFFLWSHTLTPRLGKFLHKKGVRFNKKNSPQNIPKRTWSYLLFCQCVFFPFHSSTKLNGILDNLSE